MTTRNQLPDQITGLAILASRMTGRFAVTCLCAGLLLLVSSCNSGSGGQSGGSSETSTSSDSGTGDTGEETAGAGTERSFSLSLSKPEISLAEGVDAISVDLVVSRVGAHQGEIQLQAWVDGTELPELQTVFSESSLAPAVSDSRLWIQLELGMAPIQPQQRKLVIQASDGQKVSVQSLLLNIRPTSAPDVYLLIGQSNMEGYSEYQAAQKGAGGADQPHPRIRQLNVTGNDFQNFTGPADFENRERNVGWPAIVNAEDPLHVGYEPSIDGKSQDYIGPGLSFAKAALPDTTANIVLVPAAWAGSGFCDHTNGEKPYLAWNPFDTGKRELRGNALFKRAVYRTNQALQETGGVLRGILWHQGEADSSDQHCAEAYRQQLQTLARELRSQIQEDARGGAARGAGAPVPFVVGTMSRGRDSRGDYSGFDQWKSLVDTAHRGVEDNIPFSAWVNADDLVPPAYPCGNGSCIHFGSAAYRELGNRYYQQLQSVLLR